MAVLSNISFLGMEYSHNDRPERGGVTMETPSIPYGMQIGQTAYERGKKISVIRR
jgi:hypothetical protein